MKMQLAVDGTSGATLYVFPPLNSHTGETRVADYVRGRWWAIHSGREGEERGDGGCFRVREEGCVGCAWKEEKDPAPRFKQAT